MLQDRLQAAVLGEQLDGGFFADARNAGNVVAGIPHEALQVRNLLRGDAEVLQHLFRGVQDDLRDAALGVEHAGLLRHQLQGIPVPGDEQGGDAGFFAAPGHGAQDVIRLEGGAGELLHAHVGKAFANQGELGAQFRGHGLPGALVLRVLGVAERRPFHIEGHGQVVRMMVGYDLEQHGQKAENGIGEYAVLIGKGRQGMEGPVHEAVAVNDDKRIPVLHERPPTV